MLYAFVCYDRAGALPERQEHRPVHLAHLKGLGDRLFMAGPLLDEAGQPKGSLVVVDCADRAEAEATAAADPFAKLGIFERVEVEAFRKTLPES